MIRGFGLIVMLAVVLNVVGSAEVGAIQSWYMEQLELYPFMTKALTAAFVGCFGDFIAQLIEFHSHQIQKSASIGGSMTYDHRRGLSLLIDGIVSAPIMHVGYDLFEKIVPVDATPGETEIPQSLAALIHVLLDLIILDSIFIATTFIITGIGEGYSLRLIVPQLQAEYIPSLKATWLASGCLMPIQFACFRYFPVSLRVLAMNTADIFCDAVVSFMAHRKRHGWEREGSFFWTTPPTTKKVPSSSATTSTPSTTVSRLTPKSPSRLASETTQIRIRL